MNLKYAVLAAVMVDKNTISASNHGLRQASEHISSSSSRKLVAQVNTPSVPPPSTYVESLIDNLLADSGISKTNIAFTSSAKCFATYTNGQSSSTIFPNEGSILSSGFPESILDGSSQVLNTGEDVDLNSLIPQTTRDKCFIEFELTCPNNGALVVDLNYVFATNESPNAGEVNDVFGLFVNDVNVALIPNINIPISVRNVAAHVTQSGYFPRVDNSPIYAYTNLLNAAAGPLAGANTIKLAIADASDAIVNSWALIENGAFECNYPPFTSLPISDELVECGETIENMVVTFEDPDPEDSVHLSFSTSGEITGLSITINGNDGPTPSADISWDPSNIPYVYPPIDHDVYITLTASDGYTSTSVDIKLTSAGPCSLCTNEAAVPSDDAVPEIEIKPNHFVLENIGSGEFTKGLSKETQEPLAQRNPEYTLTDTLGCNCEHILNALEGKNKGLYKFGCPRGIMKCFVGAVHSEGFTYAEGTLNCDDDIFDRNLRG